MRAFTLIVSQISSAQFSSAIRSLRDNKLINLNSRATLRDQRHLDLYANSRQQNASKVDSRIVWPVHTGV